MRTGPFTLRRFLLGAADEIRAHLLEVRHALGGERDANAVHALLDSLFFAGAGRLVGSRLRGVFGSDRRHQSRSLRARAANPRTTTCAGGDEGGVRPRARLTPEGARVTRRPRGGARARSAGTHRGRRPGSTPPPTPRRAFPARASPRERIGLRF